MSALISKRGPHRRLRRRSLSAFALRGPTQGPPERRDFDEEAIELIGPGNERADGDT
jgi:hypothetical protein